MAQNANLIKTDLESGARKTNLIIIECAPVVRLAIIFPVFGGVLPLKTTLRPVIKRINIRPFSSIAGNIAITNLKNS